jgi:hypothetical protein
MNAPGSVLGYSEVCFVAARTSMQDAGQALTAARDSQGRKETLLLGGSQIQSTDHPECEILKSDAVVNIEMRPEPNSFDLFLEKEPSHPAGIDRHSGYGPQLAKISDFLSISWRAWRLSIASLATEG